MTHTPDTERMFKWQLQRTPYESEIDIVSDGRVIATVEAGEGQVEGGGERRFMKALSLFSGIGGLDLAALNARKR